MEGNFDRRLSFFYMDSNIASLSQLCVVIQFSLSPDINIYFRNYEVKLGLGRNSKVIIVLEI